MMVVAHSDKSCSVLGVKMEREKWLPGEEDNIYRCMPKGRSENRGVARAGIEELFVTDFMIASENFGTEQILFQNWGPCVDTRI